MVSNTALGTSTGARPAAAASVDATIRACFASSSVNRLAKSTKAASLLVRGGGWVDGRARAHWRHWLPSWRRRKSANSSSNPVLQPAQMVRPHARHQWRRVKNEKVTPHGGHVACALSTGIMEYCSACETGQIQCSVVLADDILDKSLVNPILT
jgi:hypothetical protein